MLRKLLTIAILLIGTSAFAQVHLGYGLGVNVSHSFLQLTKVKVAPKMELLLPIELGKTSMLDLSLRYSEYGYKDVKDSLVFDNVSYDLTAMEVGIVYKQFLGGRRAKTRPYYGGGLKLGYLLNAKQSVYYDSTSTESSFFYDFGHQNDWEEVNRIRLGLIAETGLAIKMGKTTTLNLGISYDYDFQDLFTDPEEQFPEDNAGLGIITLNSRIIFRL